MKISSPQYPQSLGVSREFEDTENSLKKAIFHFRVFEKEIDEKRTNTLSVTNAPETSLLF